MLLTLMVIVFLSLGGSFFCSMTEAALYSISPSFIRQGLSVSPSSRSLHALENLKSRMSQPIAAILILNTVANTTGPALAGVVAEHLFGHSGLIAFTVVMTLAVLVVGEVIPKYLGVSYARHIAPSMALPLYGVVRIFKPLIIVLEWFTEHVKPNSAEPTVSHHEVLSLTALGAEEGTIDNLEGSVIKNIIGLDQTLVRSVLTPRLSVFKVPANQLIGATEKQIVGWNYTRIPIHDPNDVDNLVGYVRQRDIYRALVAGKENETLSSIARPLETVPELMRVDKLLVSMLERRDHICSVVDEHGSLAGIVTLEDLLEEVVGREITDEYDTAREKR